jgi:hypothetical protein
MALAVGLVFEAIIIIGGLAGGLIAFLLGRGDPLLPRAPASAQAT